MANKVVASARKSSKLSVNVTGAEHISLTDIAERMNVSVSWVIGQAIREYLERNRPDQASLPLPFVVPGKKG